MSIQPLLATIPRSYRRLYADAVRLSVAPAIDTTCPVLRPLALSARVGPSEGSDALPKPKLGALRRCFGARFSAKA